MNYLGLDYGEKYIGVAIATGPLAEPLTTISTDAAFASIKSLVHKQNIQGLVLGVADPDAHPSINELVQKFAPLKLPVYLVDETLTSHDARQALLHTTRIRRKNLEHAVAATLILQAWIDSSSQSHHTRNI